MIQKRYFSGEMSRRKGTETGDVHGRCSFHTAQNDGQPYSLVSEYMYYEILMLQFLRREILVSPIPLYK